MIHYQIGFLPPNLPGEIQKYLPTIQADGKWQDENREHSFYAAIYYQLALNLNAQKILELGTRHQLSTQIFIEALRQTGGHIWSIDKTEYACKIPKDDHQYVTFITSDDMDYEWTEMVDILFIDSSHKYQHTMDQMDKYWPFVKTPGVMVLADGASHPEQGAAIDIWAIRQKIGYLKDSRGHGADYFFKPTYPFRYGDAIDKRGLKNV